MFFRKKSNIQSRQARLDELDKRYKIAKDALVLEYVRGQIIDLNNALKRMERFWNREASGAEGEEIKAIAIFNSAKEAVDNIGSNCSVIEYEPFYKKIIDNFSILDSQFNVRDVEKLVKLISMGECIITEEEQQRQQMINELSNRLADEIVRILSLGKIKNAIASVAEIQTMVEQIQANYDRTNQKL